MICIMPVVSELNVALVVMPYVERRGRQHPFEH